MLGKGASKQALSEMTCTHTFTHSHLHTRRALPQGLKQKTGVLSKAPLNC